MSEPAATDELEPLLERLCLGELDPTGWRRLGELIRGDRAAALRYAEAAQYCETLREETAGSQRDATPTAFGGELTTSTPRVAPDANEPTNAGRWSLSRLVPWGLAVSAAFLGGWFIANGSGETPRARVAVAAPSPSPWLTESGRVEPLGRLTGLTPEASSDGLLRSLKVGSQLGRGEVFQITRGSARLEIGGGEVLVEGPAELSAIDTRTVFLRQGSVTARHPGRFTIQTPLALVTGEAASFAVVANADTDALVVAVDGPVVADLAPQQLCSDDSSACHLTVGEALRFEATGEAGVRIDRDAPAPEGLLLAWDATAAELHEYERLVLADEPLAYWPLYRVRRHRAVLDLTQNGFDGYAIGNWPTELSDIHATQTRGSYFDGESYVETDRKPPIDLRTGLTIESWARVAGGPEYQSVFTSRWVLESNTPNEQCFGFTVYAGQNDKWQFWTGSGEYGQNWRQLHAPADVTRDRWTHVTASFEPDAGQAAETVAVVGASRLYIDGELVAEARHTMSLTDFDWPARIGAAEFVPKSLTSWLFRGELRDVALYDHVLDPTRIERHSKVGRTAT